MHRPHTLGTTRIVWASRGRPRAMLMPQCGGCVGTRPKHACMREALSETHTLVKQVPPLDDAAHWSEDAAAYEIGMGCRW